ncbi:hypothetical protein D3C85_1262410 [compost metagenome]
MQGLALLGRNDFAQVIGMFDDQVVPTLQDGRTLLGWNILPGHKSLACRFNSCLRVFDITVRHSGIDRGGGRVDYWESGPARGCAPDTIDEIRAAQQVGLNNSKRHITLHTSHR